MNYNVSKESEMHRRKFNEEFDSTPSIGHEFNLKISKQYIKGKIVLDVGCWSGQFELLSSKYATRIVGVDPGKQAINYARKKNKKAEFLVADALNLPFKKNIFDTVTFFDVIEHLPVKTELRALKEIYRVLKLKGYLILATPNNHPISILLDPAYFLYGHRHYSMKTLKNLLTLANFKVIKTYQSGGIFRMGIINIETIIKHLFGKKLFFPLWVEKIIKKEVYNKGFIQNYLIAQKHL